MRNSTVVALLAASAFALFGQALFAQGAPASGGKPSAAPSTLTDLDAPNDPFIWLEDVESPRSLAWVDGQNKLTAKRLESDRRYALFHDEALAIFTAKDRIAEPEFLGDGIANLWQDAAHPKGLWRRTTLSGYRAADTPWETLIDLDALGKAEGRDLIFKGATCLAPEDRLCLVRLSNGGKDAVEIREFDTRSKTFVANGFHVPEGKNSVQWMDKDTLLVATDWSGTGADLSRAGYPLEVRTVKRGQPLAAAATLFRGQPSDNQVNARVLRGRDHEVAAVVVDRGVSFFEGEHFLITPNGPARLPLPRKASLDGLVDGQLVFTIREDWQGHAGGALLSCDLADLKRDPARARATLVLQPGPTQAVEATRRTRNRLLVSMLDNVKGAVDSYAHGPDGWTHVRLALPPDSSVVFDAASDDDDRAFITTEGFLTPPTLWLADAASGAMDKVKSLPARFDGSGDVVEQLFATSADGTRIPYFIVRPKGMAHDGSHAVQMFGYGGFEVAVTPVYKPELGKLWLERGGVYVMANLRGGGEFGPRWHEAAMREHRQRAFDDFAAVAKDLMARKITSPRHMGIYARSNGGILTTVSMTQHPELFNAVVVESPLIDMLRYHKLSAGASWMAEYGDPDVASDRAFIAQYSGYQNLKPGVKYPEPYVTTNTKDDRVHPGHPRKFAAKMESMGYPVLYYENTFGGHANDADPELNARRWARHYVYLSQKLMD
jgi:prolyl oligopeptidase